MSKPLPSVTITKRGTWTKWWTAELAKRAHQAELKRLRGGRR